MKTISQQRYFGKNQPFEFDYHKTTQNQRYDFIPPLSPYAYCLYTMTNVVLNDGRRISFYPVFVGPRIISGWELLNNQWYFIGINIVEIKYFNCFQIV